MEDTVLKDYQVVIIAPNPNSTNFWFSVKASDEEDAKKKAIEEFVNHADTLIFAYEEERNSDDYNRKYYNRRYYN